MKFSDPITLKDANGKKYMKVTFNPILIKNKTHLKDLEEYIMGEVVENSSKWFKQDLDLSKMIQNLYIPCEFKPGLYIKGIIFHKNSFQLETNLCNFFDESKTDNAQKINVDDVSMEIKRPDTPIPENVPPVEDVPDISCALDVLGVSCVPGISDDKLLEIMDELKENVEKRDEEEKDKNKEEDNKEDNKEDNRKQKLLSGLNNALDNEDWELAFKIAKLARYIQ